MQLRRCNYHECEIAHNINGSPCFCGVLRASPREVQRFLEMVRNNLSQTLPAES